MDTNVFIQILINLITISLRVANNERSSEKPISYSLRNFLNSTTWLEILIVNQIIDIISIENSTINILWSVTKYTILKYHWNNIRKSKELRFLLFISFSNCQSQFQHFRYLIIFFKINSNILSVKMSIDIFSSQMVQQMARYS